MTTLAKQARDLAKALLLNQTAAGARVFILRRQPLRPPALPCLLIYTERDDGAGFEGAAPPQTRHTLTTTVEAVLAADDDADLDLQLDAFEATIKRRLMNSAEFVALFETVTGVRCDRALGDAGEQRFAGLRVQVDGLYFEHWQPEITDDLHTLSLGLDAVDPADPNTGNPGYPGGAPGPDGRKEGGFTLDLSTEP